MSGRVLNCVTLTSMGASVVLKGRRGRRSEKTTLAPAMLISSTSRTTAVTWRGRRLVRRAVWAGAVLGQQRLQIGDPRLLAADRQLGRLQRHLGEMHLADEGLDRGEADAEAWESGRPGRPACRRPPARAGRHRPSRPGSVSVLPFRTNTMASLASRRPDGMAEGQQLRGNVRQVVGEVQVGHVDIQRGFQGVGERLGLALDRVPGPVHDRRRVPAGQRSGYGTGYSTGTGCRHSTSRTACFFWRDLVAEVRAAINHLDIVDREAHRLRRLASAAVAVPARDPRSCRTRSGRRTTRTNGLVRRTSLTTAAHRKREDASRFRYSSSKDAKVSGALRLLDREPLGAWPRGRTD